MCGLGLKLPAPPCLEDKLNDSTFALIKRSLKRLNRHRLLRSRSKLFCQECNKVRQVTDYFASGESLMDCGHRRPAFLLDENVAQEFQKETEARTARRELVGYMAPTAGGNVHQYVEEVAA
jgi:hypothetical protein